MLLATCTCSPERCLFKSIACFSTGHCQRSLLNILDSGHHLHFQKTPLPGCGVGVFISAHSRVTDPGSVPPASFSAAGVTRGVRPGSSATSGGVSMSTLCPGHFTQHGLPLRFAEGSTWSSPSPGLGLPPTWWRLPSAGQREAPPRPQEPWTLLGMAASFGRGPCVPPACDQLGMVPPGPVAPNPGGTWSPARSTSRPPGLLLLNSAPFS